MTDIQTERLLIDNTRPIDRGVDLTEMTDRQADH